MGFVLGLLFCFSEFFFFFFLFFFTSGILEFRGTPFCPFTGPFFHFFHRVLSFSVCIDLRYKEFGGGMWGGMGLGLRLWDVVRNKKKVVLVYMMVQAHEQGACSSMVWLHAMIFSCLSIELNEMSRENIPFLLSLFLITHIRGI